MSPYAMQRIPPSPQMREALTAQVQAGHAGHPLRQFVARVAEILLQVGPLRAGPRRPARLAERLRRP